jgi:L-lactate dehydrogenase complex protein LldG
MTTAREEILALVRASHHATPSPVPRGYRRIGALTVDACAKMFATRVADYRAEVREVAAADIPTAIASVCLELGVVRLGVPAGFPVELRPDSLDVVEDHDLSPRELDALGGVATGCTVAIAETGTIILAGGSAEGRRALTLVPDLHICVIRRDQIVELVAEAHAMLDDLVKQGRRPLTFISGPSATSDIELSRVEGVHGPRTLVALISEEEP